MKCAVYTRVSTDNQAEVEFNSCEAQEEKIKSFIKSQENMELFKVYSDPAFTGANLNRPALNAMLDDIKEHNVNLVISYKIDRLTRSPKDFYQLIELFDKYGVDFISVTERFDTSTPSGRLLRNIMLTFAQFERELASERTKDKMLQRAFKGMWNGGVVPYGYRIENKKLLVDKTTSEVVKDIFDLYVSSGSVAAVYNEMQAKGFDLSKSKISYILRNTIYTGKIKYVDKIYQGLHQAIIPDEIFKLAQEAHKKKHVIMRVYKNFPLGGLLKCKSCNSYMTPCYTIKKKRDGKTHYYYYRCTKTFKRDWGRCQTRQISADRLENYIFENLERISLDRQYINSLIFKLNNSGSVDRTGLELSHESSKISPEIFELTLRLLVKGLSERKGIEKNLWVKKFIKNILYSKEEILLTLYYKTGFENEGTLCLASGRVGAAAGREMRLAACKKIPYISRDIGDDEEWLSLVDEIRDYFKGSLEVKF